jgi:CubicO group peptidase (beta-lactamase class C family)
MLPNVSLPSRRTASGALFLTLLLCSTVRGQAPMPTAKAGPPAAAGPKTGKVIPVAGHELTAEDLGVFLDGVMKIELERDDIAGGVISVVKDGKVLFEKGYGYADVAKKKPVSPEDTLFRPGSVSKLFTGTAVMQLVEQGRLDLDRDVNDYLDFKFPATYAQPVTLRRILTHTAGFEEVAKDLFTRTPSSLSQYIVTHVPARIYAPGTMGAYSNYGVALAGYVVHRVSGEPFDQYVTNHIFKSLGMVHSTFSQPLPPSLAPLMSDGYEVASGGSKPFEEIHASPAGALSTSGDDMTHFMIAHLQDGHYGDVQILRAETAQLMHSRQYAGDPALNGIAISFFEESRNGHRIIGHGGDTMYFHSDLHLILDANVGFFISVNSAGRDDFDHRDAIWKQFLERYFPYPLPAIPTVVTAPADARALTGSYLASRRGDTNFFKAGALLGEVAVSAKPDGTLVIDRVTDFNGQPMQWHEIGPLVYQRVGEQEHIVFKPQASGQVVIMTDDASFALQRVSWYQSRPFLLTSLASTGIVFLLVLLLWPGGALIRRHYRRPLVLGTGERRLRLLVRLICVLDAAVILGWAVLAGRFYSPELAPPSLVLALLEFAGLIGALGTMVVFYQVCKSWVTTGRWIWAKIADTVVLLACMVFAWFVWIGHLANFNLHY